MRIEYKPADRENSSWTLFTCNQIKKSQSESPLSKVLLAAQAAFIAPLADGSQQVKAVFMKSYSRLGNLYYQGTVPSENEWKVIAKHATRATAHFAAIALLGLCLPVKWKQQWRSVPLWPALFVPTVVAAMQERLLGLFALDYDESPKSAQGLQSPESMRDLAEEFEVLKFEEKPTSAESKPKTADLKPADADALATPRSAEPTRGNPLGKPRARRVAFQH